MKKKISTAEHAETAEYFLPKDENQGSLFAYFILSAFSRISAVGGSFLHRGIKIVLSLDPSRMKTTKG